MTPPDSNQTAEPSSWLQRYRALSLGVKILLFMVVGIGVGIVAGERAQIVQPLGDLFIRLLMMAVIPLVFFNLLAGITGLDNPLALGRVGGKIVGYFLATTILALVFGLVAMHLLHPGAGMQLREQVARDVGQVPGVADVFLNLVPRNIFQAFATGQVAQVVVFAIFLAIATLLLPDEPRGLLRSGYVALADVLRKLVWIVLYFAPIGIGALAAATVGRFGATIFGPLAPWAIAYTRCITTGGMLWPTMNVNSPFSPWARCSFQACTSRCRSLRTATCR